MKFGYYAIILLFCGLVLAGCVGRTGENTVSPDNQTTAAMTPESANTLDKAYELFGNDLPVPVYLPDNYSFVQVSRNADGLVTISYTGPDGDFRITKLQSYQSANPEEPIGNRTSTVQGSWTGGAVEGQLTFEGDNRSDGSLWQFRWNRNEDAYFMVGRLPWNEGVEIAASVGAET